MCVVVFLLEVILDILFSSFVPERCLEKQKTKKGYSDIHLVIVSEQGCFCFFLLSFEKIKIKRGFSEISLVRVISEK